LAGWFVQADDVCLIYAELRAAASHGRSTVSRDHNKHVLVCGRQSGHRLVYSSSTENQLSVTVHAPAPPGEHPLHFLLQFDGLYRYLSALHGQAGLMQLSGVRPSVRLSVCLSRPSTARRGGGFAAVGPAGRCRSMAAHAAADSSGVRLANCARQRMRAVSRLQPA